MVKIQRNLTRRFIAIEEDIDWQKKNTFAATLETLACLAEACAAKRPRRSKKENAAGRLIAQRRHGHCLLCGAESELSAHLSVNYWPPGNDISASKNPRLSSRYCTAHKPQMANGSSNPAYRRAKRSMEDFQIEFNSLSLHAGSIHASNELSENSLAHRYAQATVEFHDLCLADKSELRALARRLVDARLTDRKKRIVMGLACGLSQSDIARKLGVSRQAVSKALSSIPDEFRLDVQPMHQARPLGPQHGDGCNVAAFASTYAH